MLSVGVRRGKDGDKRKVEKKKRGKKTRGDDDDTFALG